MENVVLVVHLLLALSLIAVVLMQSSEGGGLGMGGGSVASGRTPQTALGKVTWALATCFILTSIALTIIAAEKAAGTSVVDRITDAPAPAPAADTPTLPGLGEEGLLPPAPGDAEPLIPSGE
jgi:preprotein translocase subunit SecG